MASAVNDKIMCHMTAIFKALDCAICLSIIKSPVSMGCGHFFCRPCIAEVLKSNYRTPCPLCKRPFTRRSIENANKRNSIVLAAGRLALECGKLTGSNIISPDSLNIFKDIDDTSCSPIAGLNGTKENPKQSKSKKRKSQENDGCKNELNSGSCASNTEAKVLIPEDISTKSVPLQESNKRQCQSLSDDEYNSDYELPSLDDILLSVQKPNLAQQQESSDKVGVEEKRLSNTPNRKGLKVSFADTPAVSCGVAGSVNHRVSTGGEEAYDGKDNRRISNNKESPVLQSRKMKAAKFRETIQNKKNALKNKTNQLISEGNGNILNKTPGNKKKSVDDSIKSLDDEKAKENINKKMIANEDSSLTNKTKLVPMSPKSSSKERSKMKSDKSKSSKISANQEAEQELISKLKAAENFTLTVVNTRQALNTVSECCSLNETNLPTPNSDDCEMNDVQVGQEEVQSTITDTAVSVQSVVSPAANKLETLSKSPGWSKVRQVGKDFRVKKFSKLRVEKNFLNSCPTDAIEDSNKNSNDEMPKLIKISELERKASKGNTQNVEDVSVKNKSETNRRNQQENETPSGHSGTTMTVMAEIHSRELCNSNLKENESSYQSKENENLPNYDETETSFVANTLDKTQCSSSNKYISSNENISNKTGKVPYEGMANLNGSCIPSPDMPSLKPTALDHATDICTSNAEINCSKENEFSENMQTEPQDTFDSHIAENYMEVDENNKNILLSPNNGVQTYMKQMIRNVSSLDVHNTQQFLKVPLNATPKQTKSSDLSPKFRSICKSLTTGTKTLFAGDDTVFYASHSQQTSQRLLDFSGDNNTKYNSALVPAPGLSWYPNLNFSSKPVQNQVALLKKCTSSSEKTKVLKRTCLTLEEIQDAFSNCSDENPATICSLPFGSGEFRLDINVADETLNVSILKVDSFERPKETVEKPSTVMYAEKNIQTSNFPPSPISVLPSSNAESESSSPKNNKRPTKNLFPYLNQYFSDSEPSQQGNVLPEDNEDPLDVSEVLPYHKSDYCIPVRENVSEETECVAESMKTLLSELQALPAKDFSLDDQIVTYSESVYAEVKPDKAPLIHSKELIKDLPVTDLSVSVVQRGNVNETVSEKGIDKETLNHSNGLVISCVTRQCDESFSYDALPPTLEANENRDNSEINKNKHNSSIKNSNPQSESSGYLEKLRSEGLFNQTPKCNSNLDLKKFKSTEKVDQIEFVKKCSPSPSQRQRIVPSGFHPVNKSHRLSLLEKYPEEEADPDLAMAAELIGPLKDLAEEMKASGKADTGETSFTSTERVGNQKRPLEIFEEMVLSNKLESPGTCLPSQRSSRLSLRSKGNPKKFKRIQTCDESSDSDKEDIVEQNSPRNNHGKVLPLNSKECNSSPVEHPTTHSFASEDLTNGNTTDIAMEIESLDEKIKSVLTKLKDIGREDLLDCENGPDAISKEDLSLSLADDNDAASDDSQKSTDIFSVPPTPPDALSPDHQTLKTARWKN